MKKKRIIIDLNLKKQIIDTVSRYAEKRLKGYREPERKGLNRGDPIGLSKSKRLASIFMVLFPIVHNRLQEIADLAGVPVASLKIWRIQADFKDAVMEEALELGKSFASLIKGLIENDSKSIIGARRLLGVRSSDTQFLIGSLVDVLACLDPLTHEWSYELRGKIPELVYLTIMRDLTGRKNPAFDKAIVDHCFNVILHPADFPGISEEDRLRIGEGLKVWMLKMIEEKR